MSKINIRESLNKLDLKTNNMYDLLNIYNCSKISNEKKKELAEALNKENISAKTIYHILNEDFAINIFPRGSEEYFKLDKVSSWLTYFSPNNVYYRVEKTYFDYGQGWMWTTIIARRENGDSWQAINPRQQKEILLANSDEELKEIAKKILRESRLDKGFYESLKEDVNKGYWKDESWSEGGEKRTLLTYYIDGVDNIHGAITTGQIGSSVFEKCYIYVNNSIKKSKTGFESRTEAKKWVEDTINKMLKKNESLTEDLDTIINTPVKEMNDETYRELKSLVDEYLRDRKALGDWPDSSDERMFVKKWYRLADKCKEIAKNGMQGITGYGRLKDFFKIKVLELARTVDNTFLWYVRNTLEKFGELKESLGNREKSEVIKFIINAEDEDELKKIVNDVYFYDRPLYLKLRHFNKKNSMNEMKDYLIKVLQDSLEESLNESEQSFVKKAFAFDIYKDGDKYIVINGDGDTVYESDNTLDCLKWAKKNSSKAYNFNNEFDFSRLKESKDLVEDTEEKVCVFTKDKYDGKTYYHGWMTKEEADKHYPDRLKEAIEDEVDFDDYNDYGYEVEEGNVFFEDGNEWVWEERIAGPIHLDFDNWAVWSAKEAVDIRDYLIGQNDNGGWKIDEKAFIEARLNSPTTYFVVDEDTGFIDWGPVENEIEAKDFLNSKVDDWENDDFDESLDKKEIKEDYNNSEKFELYYDDIDGEKSDYYFEIPYKDVLEFLSIYAEDEENAPQNKEDLLKYVDDHFDRLYSEYAYEVLEHFYEDAEISYQGWKADREDYMRDIMQDRDTLGW